MQKMEPIGIIKNSFIIFVAILLYSCKNNINTSQSIPKATKIHMMTPSFNQDSAYAYVKQQVEFGPRVPNSLAHQNCHNYLVNTLKRFGAKVAIQSDIVNRYDGLEMNMKNIIASFNPDNYKRILLCAHWDTRFIADNDTKDIDLPILGANDGGSGVGVLLEIARQISLNPINIGIDIIFFDVEDQGPPNNEINSPPHSWCLGSQYWSRSPHQQNYFAEYGILLDMVGAKDAKFTKEGVSVQFGSRIVNKIWDIASNIGYSNFFVDQKTPPIIDDHLYINNLIHIPTINIVEYDQNTHNRFNENHHKHSDNMDIIDPITLRAVGQTVLEVIYQE